MALNATPSRMRISSSASATRAVGADSKNATSGTLDARGPTAYFARVTVLEEFLVIDTE